MLCCISNHFKDHGVHSQNGTQCVFISLYLILNFLYFQFATCDICWLQLIKLSPATAKKESTSFSPRLLRTVQLCSVIGASGAVKLKPLQAECATVTEVSLGGTPSTATADVALQSLPEPANLQKTKYNNTLIQTDYFSPNHSSSFLTKIRVLRVQYQIVQLENSLNHLSV